VEFSVVLFDGEWSPEPGGWADVEGWNGDTEEMEDRGPQIPDIASFGRVLDEVFERWRSASSD